MHRRRDEHPRRGDRHQRGAHVARIERAVAVQREPVLEREQHGRLEAVHVLRRHGADQGRARNAIEPERARLGDGATRERAPELDVRRRRPGGAGGERNRRHLRRGQHRGRGFARWGIEPLPVADRLERAPADRFVGEAVEIRILPGEPQQELGGTARRQQAHLAAHERGGERHREAVAIGAEVHDVRAPWQALGERGYVGQEIADARARPARPREGFGRGAQRDQRNAGDVGRAGHFAVGRATAKPAAARRRSTASGGTWG